MYEVRVVHPDEKPDRAHRLGRIVEHDERSRGFAAKVAKKWPTTSVRWKRRVPIFDQGDLGSCTANAGLGCLGTDPYYNTVVQEKVTWDELTAVTIYQKATHLDHIPGHYPPDDTGSSGNAVAKALRAEGWIGGWSWAFSLKAALSALTKGPIIVGVNWYAGMDNPANDGLVKVSGSVEGGHEFVWDEIVITGGKQDDNLVGCQNSWGADWGKEGRFYLTWKDAGRLLDEYGDATIFRAL